MSRYGQDDDDEKAEKLGFRGGTVAGDLHMNHFPPVLPALFGNAWFERGNLSLSFRNVTVDRERVRVRVRVFAEPLAPGAKQTRAWMEREDGMLVCSGTAALGDHADSELRTKDLRPCDPANLRILHRLNAGMSLGSYDVVTHPAKQFARFDTKVISDPLAWYREPSPWGEPVAAPCTIPEYLRAYPMQGLQPYVGESVGLFGAIEIGHVHGPMLMNRRYRLTSEVLCVGQRPQTEYLWYQTSARNESGDLVAIMRMQSRAMKASSPAYQDSARTNEHGA